MRDIRRNHISGKVLLQERTDLLRRNGFFLFRSVICRKKILAVDVDSDCHGFLYSGHHEHPVFYFFRLNPVAVDLYHEIHAA